MELREKKAMVEDRGRGGGGQKDRPSDSGVGVGRFENYLIREEHGEKKKQEGQFEIENVSDMKQSQFGTLDLHQGLC